MKTAIIYTRVSTDEQAEAGYSLKYQEDALKKYCDANNIRLSRCMTSSGITRSESTARKATVAATASGPWQIPSSSHSNRRRSEWD